MRIWVARPEPGASRTAAALAERGHAALVAPVLTVRATGAALPPERPDALILTSAQGVATLDAAALRGLPVFAVGTRTAEAAAAAGLGPVHDAGGGAGDLVGLVRARLGPGARLLHPAGADRKAEPAASLTAAGYRVTTLVAYAAAALSALPEAVSEALRRGHLDGALHYSRRSAEVARDLAAMATLGGAFAALRHYCLSADVAAPLAEAGIVAHFVPARPREGDLLAGLD
ncbi:uroporphyrinogen-III synthase [Methylobacterium sp. A54F]